MPQGERRIMSANGIKQQIVAGNLCGGVGVGGILARGNSAILCNLEKSPDMDLWNRLSGGTSDILLLVGPPRENIYAVQPWEGACSATVALEAVKVEYKANFLALGELDEKLASALEGLDLLLALVEAGARP